MGAHTLNISVVWLVPPRVPTWQVELVRVVRARVPDLQRGLWVMSSGTQSVDQVKFIGLDRDAVFASAEGVNTFLGASAKDVWSIAIPEYHIGGYAITARAALTGSRVVRFGEWDPQRFREHIASERVTLTSLVPTQVHDLVQHGLTAPPPLRVVVVGGGSLSPALYTTARSLGWPLLPSYGLTECASQVATAPLQSLQQPGPFPEFAPLPHIEVDLRDEGRIFVRSRAVCRFVATARKNGTFTLESPVRAGWLPTEDLGEKRAEGLRILGRRDDVVKVLGTLVPIAQVEHDLQAAFTKRGDTASVCVLAMTDPRAGARLIAVTDSKRSLREVDELIALYNQNTSGPFRISQLCWINEVPRTALGKIAKARMRAELKIT